MGKWVPKFFLYFYAGLLERPQIVDSLICSSTMFSLKREMLFFQGKN